MPVVADDPNVPVDARANERRDAKAAMPDVNKSGAMQPPAPAAGKLGRTIPLEFNQYELRARKGLPTFLVLNKYSISILTKKYEKESKKDASYDGKGIILFP